MDHDLRNLDAWTYDTIRHIVETKEFEPACFEYRAVLNPQRGDPERLNERLRKTVCAMANTDGGYVIFGVLDRAARDGPAEQRIVGIPAGGDLLKELGDKLKGIRLQPSFEVTTRPIALPAESNRVLFGVHVPLSPRRPHEVDGTFYRRNEGGFNEPMEYHQVRDQMLLTDERLRKLTLLRLDLLQLRGVTARILDEGP
ncbi:MAG: ATP-binding protein, partial [Chloroflexi bacterium]|nr:ATP-binding protein [Chloroflexota bacterium]